MSCKKVTQKIIKELNLRSLLWYEKGKLFQCRPSSYEKNTKPFHFLSKCLKHIKQKQREE